MSRRAGGTQMKDLWHHMMARHEDDLVSEDGIAFEEALAKVTYRKI